MGMEVDLWIREGLIDYVSPSEGWNTDFNMDIRPWVDLTKNTHCTVYPGFNGLIAAEADVCLPGEYTIENNRARSAAIKPEHVRALAKRLYADGADGMSSFNLYTGFYKYLSPLKELIAPDHLDTGDRLYTFLKEPLYRQHSFLKLRLSADCKEKLSIKFLNHENLNDTQTHLRFKALGLYNIADLIVSLNGHNIPSERFTHIQHNGAGFLYLQCQLVSGEILDGENKITFSPVGQPAKEVIIQETEIRVHPQHVGQ
jgi:hypothetical protein